MTDLERLREDRLMRDVAKQMLTDDVANLKGDVEEKGVAARFVTRMKEGAEGVVEESSDFARENPGRVGSMITLALGLLLGWIFRNEIAGLIHTLWPAEPDGEEGIPPAEPAETPEIQSGDNS